MVLPGEYSVSLAKNENGSISPLGESQTFEVVPLNDATFPAADRAAVLAFQRELGELQRVVLAASAVIDETHAQVSLLDQVTFNSPNADPALVEQIRRVELRLLDIQVQLTGDGTVSSRAELTAPSILDRVQRAVRGQFASTADVTTTHRRDYEIAADEFTPVLESLRNLIDVEVMELRNRLEAVGAPWTQGRRLPVWRGR